LIRKKRVTRERERESDERVSDERERDTEREDFKRSLIVNANLLFVFFGFCKIIKHSFSQ